MSNTNLKVTYMMVQTQQADNFTGKRMKIKQRSKTSILQNKIGRIYVLSLKMRKSDQ